MMEEKQSISKLKLLVTIVNRGKGSEVTEFLKEFGVNCQTICLGYGTADSELLSYLGLGETEKEIVLSLITEEDHQRAFPALADKMQLGRVGHGVAFSIELNSVGGPRTYEFFSGRSERED